MRWYTKICPTPNQYLCAYMTWGMGLGCGDMQKMQTPGKPDCTHSNLHFLCFNCPHFLNRICVGCSRACSHYFCLFLKHSNFHSMNESKGGCLDNHSPSSNQATDQPQVAFGDKSPWAHAEPGPLTLHRSWEAHREGPLRLEAGNHHLPTFHTRAPPPS